MKKLLACFLAVMLCLCLLAGCGGNEPKESTATTTGTTDPSITGSGDATQNGNAGASQPSSATEPEDTVVSESDLTPYPTDENGQTSMGDLSTYPTYPASNGDLE